MQIFGHILSGEFCHLSIEQPVMLISLPQSEHLYSSPYSLPIGSNSIFPVSWSHSSGLRPNELHLVSSIDFEAMERRDNARLRPYKERLKDPFPYTKKELREKYPTEEEYIERQITFGTYAVVTPDGKWHCSFDMGMPSIAEDERKWVNTYFERFINPAIEKGWYITIVDCHMQPFSFISHGGDCHLMPRCTAGHLLSCLKTQHR